MERQKPLPPRESGELIAQRAKHVSVCEDGINSLALKISENVSSRRINIEMFSLHELHPSATDTRAVDWIFVVDTLNFCFWSPDHAHYAVSYRGKRYTGYFALCAAIKRALDEGVKITDPKYYSEITQSDLTNLLRGDEDSASLSLIAERMNCLHEVGSVLLNKYEGTFLNCVKSCYGSAQDLIQTIVHDFPCFRDEAIYEGHPVSFYKRAQILVGDIWACFKGDGIGNFRDIDAITMFPDYRVPQVLVYFGALKYSRELLEKLLSGEILKKGCPEESEIRGCSIYAVELICLKTKALLVRAGKNPCGINPILIDHFLWEYRREHNNELQAIPFHKVVSVFY